VNTYPATSDDETSAYASKGKSRFAFSQFSFASIVKQQKNCRWANAMVYYKELEVW
jgi:hypothetical protein